MGETESRTEFSFWSLWSSPLIVATDIRNMKHNEGMRRVLMNEEVIAINQDEIATAGDRLFNHSDGGQVWYKKLANGDTAILMYNSNLDKSSPNITVTVK